MNKNFIIYKVFFLLFIIVLNSPTHSKEKVLIITHAHSRPDFIELQVKTFNHFLKHGYEYVVFNDASNTDKREQIQQKCEELGIQCILIPQDIHAVPQTTNKRHAESIKFSFETLGFNQQRKIVLIDSDMFLVKPFSVFDYMGDNDFVGGLKQRSNHETQIEFSGPSLVFINMANLENKETLNFNSGYVEDLACDVGGHTYYYFRNNPKTKTFFYQIKPTHLIANEEEIVQKWRYGSKTYGMELHADGNFLHYYAGGCNWPGYPAEYLNEKNHILNTYIDEVINTYTIVHKDSDEI